MLRCLGKHKVIGYIFLLVLLSFVFFVTCTLHNDTEEPEMITNNVMPAKEQEEYKAKIMACSFVKMHLGITVGLESIYHFKISRMETYIVKGIIMGNDKTLNWSVTLRFNGSDWNNINNWAELAFITNQSSLGD